MAQRADTPWMVGEPHPVEPEQGPNGAQAEPRAGEPGPRPARPDQAGLIGQIAEAQGDPPVGLVVVGWERPDAQNRSGSTPTYEHLVERSVAFSVAACAGRSDRILASSETELAVVRSAMGGPATAEALAHRIAKQLDVELDRLAIDADRSAARWAIGVAVGRSDDGPADLLRYAEAALNDAWLLGGRRLVAFDDGDRELLVPPPDGD